MIIIDEMAVFSNTTRLTYYEALPYIPFFFLIRCAFHQRKDVF